MAISDYKVLHKGLGRQLLITILLLVIIPALLISMVSFKSSENELYTNAITELKTISGLQHRYVQDYVNQVIKDLSVESKRFSNIELAKKIIAGKKSSQLTIDASGKNIYGLSISKSDAVDLKSFWQASDYQDILLLSKTGDMLFSLAQASNFETLLTNNHVLTKTLRETAKKSYVSDFSVFSDFYFYENSSKKSISFFAKSLVNGRGEKIGVIAFQINNKKIADILRNQGGFADQIKTFLIGPDLKMRTLPNNESKDNGFNTIIQSPLVRNWVAERAGNVTDNNPSKPLAYKDTNGKDVLGVLVPIKLGNVQLFIISELEKGSLYAYSRDLAILIVILVVITIILAIIITLPVTSIIVKPILELATAATNVANGDLEQTVDTRSKYELGILSLGFNKMLRTLQNNQVENKRQAWLQEGISKLNEIIRGEQEIPLLSKNIIGFICAQINAQIGAFYIIDDDNIELKGSYAFKVRKDFQNRFPVGKGMVGQSVLEQQPLILLNVPDHYFVISSGLGNTSPKVLVIFPIIWNDTVVAVMEFGTLHNFSNLQEQYLEMLMAPIAVAVNTAISRNQTHELLQQTQRQAKTLAAREEELRENNTMLENQAKELENSRTALETQNERLQSQQEELKTTNEKLEEKARELEEAGSILEEKNDALDIARHDLQQKANDLELSSKYKSEFLANMSHELRTPLNSLLILAKLLADNKKGNLDNKQVEYASTIYDSGTDLLDLINDILDLSKIEAGQMDIYIDKIATNSFFLSIEKKLKPLAITKGIAFTLNIKKDTPENIYTDGHKLGQIVKNLLSNAFKFTAKGFVSLNIESVTDSKHLTVYDKSSDHIKISIEDTGIGIAKDKQATIFEAFKQADGTTERKYGGTGLGLSISRELVKMLGGEIQLVSKEGQGSTFSVFLPKKTDQAITSKSEESLPNTYTKNLEQVHHTSNISSIKNGLTTGKTPEYTISTDLPDDRHDIAANERVILIIEDDQSFAKILQDMANERGFKVLLEASGEMGLQMAEQYKPNAIILDIGLPVMDGHQVLARLKNNLSSRHIPVYLMSVHDVGIDAFKNGAFGYLTKPVSIPKMNEAFAKIENFIDKSAKDLLLVTHNEDQANVIKAIIGENTDIKISMAITGAQALNSLQEIAVNCIVFDLGFSNIDNRELLEEIKNNRNTSGIPIIIYAGRQLLPEEITLLDAYTQSLIIKNAHSAKLLVDSTSLFLHRDELKTPEGCQKIISTLHDDESVLNGRKVIIVDDDMRNVFALSTLLQEKNLDVLAASNGKEGLALLNENQDIDIILMDIMMPEMDGYEAIKKIRAQQKHKDLPIIALTAKATKSDRVDCISAGASDYLAKPIDTEKLLSMIRTWLYR